MCSGIRTFTLRWSLTHHVWKGLVCVKVWNRGEKVLLDKRMWFNFSKTLGIHNTIIFFNCQKQTFTWSYATFNSQKSISWCKSNSKHWCLTFKTTLSAGWGLKTMQISWCMRYACMMHVFNHKCWSLNEYECIRQILSYGIWGKLVFHCF